MHRARNVTPAVPNRTSLSLLYLPPTRQQTRVAFALIVILLLAFGATAPSANIKLPPLRDLRAILLTLIFAANLVTALLIFTQCSITRSRALLLLANGYLFSSLIMIPNVLMISGDLSSPAILGTSSQSSPFIYLIWHFGFITAVICYALLKDSRSIHTQPPIGWSILIVVGSICAITWAIVIFDNFIGQFFVDDSRLAPLAHYAAGLDLAIGIAALVILWLRRSSLLDQWLLVAVLAMAIELSLVTFFIKDRNSLGVYCIRAYLVITSITLLAALLSEKAKLYARLARSNMMLERERKNKLMNVAAVASSIAHEVRQPLMGVTASASAARRWLDRVPPDLDRAKKLLTDIEQAGFRANEVLTNVRSLFQDTDHEQKSIDVNNMTVEVLQSLHGELNDHDVKTDVELAPELPRIIGHRVQLQEVILNLVHNAIDAMAPVKVDHRTLRVRTKPDGNKAVIIEVEDSGQGIEPRRIASIFEPFVTTKPNGSGLGLAICSRIIERHSGHLTASSDGKNGASFKIVLPVEPSVQFPLAPDDLDVEASQRTTAFGAERK
jgi:signal transduction histidine kinase